MKRARIACINLLFAMAIGSAQAEDSLRPEIGKPLLAAQELLKTQKFKEALGKVREAEAIGGRTAYENFILERMRAAAAAGAGDTETATKAFEAVINSGKLAAAEQLKMMEVMAGTYYRAKDYLRTVSWLQRYQQAGGNDPQMRTLMIQSQYLNGDYAAAARGLAADLAAEEQAGRIPAENRLQLLANCQYKQQDYAGYVGSLERLLTHYPKKEYWTDLIARLQSKPGFSERLALDVLRLRHASGNLNDSGAYMEFAQLALQAGLPAETRGLVSEGFDKKLLGTGSDAARHKRLRDLAERQYEEDRAALARKARGGDQDANRLVNDGYALVTHGDFDKGIAMMESGIGLPGLKRPADARLHLGLAYLKAGNKAKAAQALRSVPRGSDGVADLARLWLLLVQPGSVQMASNGG